MVSVLIGVINIDILVIATCILNGVSNGRVIVDEHIAFMELLDAAVTLVAPDSPFGSNFDIVCNPALNLVEMAALHLLVTLIGRSNAR